MITDAELDSLISDAGAGIPEPTGADAILATARAELEPAPVASPGPHARFRSRGFAVSAIGAVAAVAIVIALVTTSSSPQLPNVATYHAAATPSILGLNATPAALNKSLPSTAPNASGGVAPSADKTAAVTQKIITTGTLSIVVSDGAMRGVVAKLQAIAASFGGYVSNSNVALAGASRGGTVVLGIPAGDFGKAVSDAEALGAIKHLSTTATDVTGQVADLGAQLAALEAARTQLEALFARAGTIPALLSVQNEITSVQSQIQQLQSQQRVLASQISFSSLTVAIAPPGGAHVAQRTGFSKAWHDAISHFVNALSTLLADAVIVLLSILLAAVVIMLAILVGRPLWSLVRRRLL